MLFECAFKLHYGGTVCENQIIDEATEALKFTSFTISSTTLSVLPLPAKKTCLIPLISCFDTVTTDGILPTVQKMVHDLSTTEDAWRFLNESMGTKGIDPFIQFLKKLRLYPKMNKEIKTPSLMKRTVI